MAITINGSGTIGGVSVGGLPDGVVDTDVLANDAVTAAKIGSLPAGSVLQVVSYADATESVSTPGAYTSIVLGSWGASITLSSASNKVLVMGNVNCVSEGNQGIIAIQYSTDNGSNWTTFPGNPTGSSLGSNTHGQLFGLDSAYSSKNIPVYFLISPGNTSFRTRALAAVDSGSNISYNRVPNNSGNGSNGVSTCVLMEIAA
jgi:hypothetical protein